MRSLLLCFSLIVALSSLYTQTSYHSIHSDESVVKIDENLYLNYTTDEFDDVLLGSIAEIAVRYEEMFDLPYDTLYLRLDKEQIDTSSGIFVAATTFANTIFFSPAWYQNTVFFDHVIYHELYHSLKPDTGIKSLIDFSSHQSIIITSGLSIVLDDDETLTGLEEGFAEFIASELDGLLYEDVSYYTMAQMIDKVVYFYELITVEEIIAYQKTSDIESLARSIFDREILMPDDMFVLFKVFDKVYSNEWAPWYGAMALSMRRQNTLSVRQKQ